MARSCIRAATGKKLMSDKDAQDELERLRRENAALKKGASPGARMKVSEKGVGTSKNRPHRSRATKLPPNDSALFPFRFADVHSRRVRDWR